jgi:transposase
VSFLLKPEARVFVYKPVVDLRWGYERLSRLVRDEMNQVLLNGDLFLFFGRSKKKMRGLCFDGTGIVLLSKILDRGLFMRIEALESEELNLAELDLLFHGGVVQRRKWGAQEFSNVIDRAIK